MRMWMAGLLAALAGIDLGIKQYIEDDFEKGEERSTKIPGIVLRKVYNKGFLLNLLEQYPRVVRAGSILTMSVIAAYDGWLLSRKGRWLHKLGMLLVTAGAISNIWDRLYRGKVVDYIGFQSKRKFFRKLTANLADLYVAAGTLLVLFTKKR